MPELPEVETVRRSLEKHLTGHTIRSVKRRRPDLRFPLPDNFSKTIARRRINLISRRGKYLLIHLTDSGKRKPVVLIAHLGMSGRFLLHPANALPTPEPHDHILFTMQDGRRLAYRDPRRFGFMDFAAPDTLQESPHLTSLGMEPLSPAFTPKRLATLFSRRKTPLKNALMDQRLIAGIGNIYACEALFRARLSPGRRAGTLCDTNGNPTPKTRALTRSIRATLKDAISAGGSTLRDHGLPSGESGWFQCAFRVYDRAGQTCSNRNCTATIRRTIHSGRSTFHCPACQR